MRAALRNWIVPTVATLALGLVVASAQDGRSAPPEVGRKAPAFKLKAIGGQDVSFPEGFKGKIVLVDFWATWCPPCRGEIPHLKEAHEKFATQGLAIVSISRDEFKKISEDKVKKFVDEKGMNWTHVYAGTEEVTRKYGVNGIPAPFLIDGDSGVVLAMEEDLRGPRLLKTIEKHLKQKKGG